MSFSRMEEEKVKTPEVKLDLEHINSMCVIESSSYKTCLEIGERNYNMMKGKASKAPGGKSKDFPDYHYPYECDILMENEKNCLNFWTRISRNFREKSLFPERGGTPDEHAKTVIVEELISSKKLPYIGTNVLLLFETRDKQNFRRLCWSEIRNFVIF